MCNLCELNEVRLCLVWWVGDSSPEILTCERGHGEISVFRVSTHAIRVLEEYVMMK